MLKDSELSRLIHLFLWQIEAGSNSIFLLVVDTECLYCSKVVLHIRMSYFKSNARISLESNNVIRQSPFFILVHSYHRFLQRTTWLLGCFGFIMIFFPSWQRHLDGNKCWENWNKRDYYPCSPYNTMATPEHTTKQFNIHLYYTCSRGAYLQKSAWKSVWLSWK